MSPQNRACGWAGLGRYRALALCLLLPSSGAPRRPCCEHSPSAFREAGGASCCCSAHPQLWWSQGPSRRFPGAALKIHSVPSTAHVWSEGHSPVCSSMQVALTPLCCRLPLCSAATGSQPMASLIWSLKQVSYISLPGLQSPGHRSEVSRTPHPSASPGLRRRGTPLSPTTF